METNDIVKLQNSLAVISADIAREERDLERLQKEYKDKFGTDKPEVVIKRLDAEEKKLDDEVFDLYNKISEQIKVIEDAINS